MAPNIHELCFAGNAYLGAMISQKRHDFLWATELFVVNIAHAHAAANRPRRFLEVHIVTIMEFLVGRCTIGAKFTAQRALSVQHRGNVVATKKFFVVYNEMIHSGHVY